MPQLIIFELQLDVINVYFNNYIIYSLFFKQRFKSNDVYMDGKKKMVTIEFDFS